MTTSHVTAASRKPLATEPTVHVDEVFSSSPKPPSRIPQIAKRALTPSEVGGSLFPPTPPGMRRHSILEVSSSEDGSPSLKTATTRKFVRLHKVAESSSPPTPLSKVRRQSVDESEGSQASSSSKLASPIKKLQVAESPRMRRNSIAEASLEKSKGISPLPGTTGGAKFAKAVKRTSPVTRVAKPRRQSVDERGGSIAPSVGKVTLQLRSSQVVGSKAEKPRVKIERYSRVRTSQIRDQFPKGPDSPISKKASDETASSQIVAFESPKDSLAMSYGHLSHLPLHLDTITEGEERCVSAAHSEKIDHKLFFETTSDSLLVKYREQTYLKVDRAAIAILCNSALQAFQKKDDFDFCDHFRIEMKTRFPSLDENNITTFFQDGPKTFKESPKESLQKACMDDLCTLFEKNQDRIIRHLFLEVFSLKDPEIEEDLVLPLSSHMNVLLRDVRLHVHKGDVTAYDLYIKDPLLSVRENTNNKVFKVFLKVTSSKYSPTRVVSISKPTSLLRDTFEEKLNTEAKISKIMNGVSNCMNVWRVVDAEKATTSYMMPYCELGDLVNYSDVMFDQIGLFPFAVRISFCYQIAQAVQGFHDKGYVHADIKPENIFLLQAPEILAPYQGLIAILGDFDLSLPQHTEPPIRGTASYIPPESFEMLFSGGIGSRTSDGSTDAWSLGVVMLYLIFPDPATHYINAIFEIYNEFINTLDRIKVLRKVLMDAKQVDEYEMIEGDIKAHQLDLGSDKIKLCKIIDDVLGELQKIDKDDPIAPMVEVLLGLLEKDPEKRMAVEKAVKLLKNVLVQFHDEIPYMYTMQKGRDFREIEFHRESTLNFKETLV